MLVKVLCRIDERNVIKLNIIMSIVDVGCSLSGDGG